AICGQTGPEQGNPLRGLPTDGQRPSPGDGPHGTIVGKAVLVRDGDERVRARLQFLGGTCRPIEKAGHGQRVSEAVDVVKCSRLLNRLLASEARLIEVAKATQVPLEIIEQSDQGVEDVERGVERAVCRIKTRQGLLQVLARGQELAEMEA